MADQSNETPAPSLDQVLQESISESAVQADEQEQVEDNKAPESEVSEEGESVDDQPAVSEESFTDIDPEKLPPELKKVYRDLQADYTRKTQRIASERKELEADRAVVEAWKPAMELYAKDARIRSRVDAAFAEAEQAAEAAGVKTEDEFAKFLEQYDPRDHETLKALKSTIEKSLRKDQESHVSKLNQELQALKQGVDRVTVEQLERDAAIEARRFQKKHPNWEESLTPRQQKLFFLELQQDPSADPSEVYESLVKEFGSATKKAESQAIDKLVAKAGKRVNSGSVTASKVEAIDTMDDAFESARRELMSR